MRSKCVNHHQIPEKTSTKQLRVENSKQKSIINIKVLNAEVRKVSVTADNIEFRNINEVSIESSQDKKCKILFDNNHSIEDKILNEQFEY